MFASRHPGDVVGTTTIGGGTVNVLAGQGTYAPTRYTILTSTGGVVGTFTNLNVATNLAFLNPTLTYDANDVYLNLTATTPVAPTNPIVAAQNPQGTPDYRVAALTRNQFATASGLTAAGAGVPGFATGRLLTALNNTTLAGARQAYDALSGEIHAGVARTLLDGSSVFRDAVLERLRGGGTAFGLGASGTALPGVVAGTYGASYAADLPGGRRTISPVAIAPTLDPTVVGLWGEGFGSFGTAYRDRAIGAATLDRSSSGFVTGIDATLASAFAGGASRIGIAGGWSETHLDLDARASRAEITSGFGALYGATSLWGLALRAGIAGAGHDVDTKRQIVFPGFADSAWARYGGYTAQGFGEIGLPIPLVGPARYATDLRGALPGDRAAVTLEPFVGGAAIRVGTDRFTETGGPAALSGFSRERDLGTVTAGLRTETRLGPAGEFLLRSSLGYRGTFGEVDPSARLALAATLGAGVNTAFPILSVPLDRHALTTETHLDWRLSAPTTIGLAYAGAYGHNASDSQVRGRLEYRW